MSRGFAAIEAIIAVIIALYVALIVVNEVDFAIPGGAHAVERIEPTSAHRAGNMRIFTMQPDELTKCVVITGVSGKWGAIDCTFKER